MLTGEDGIIQKVREAKGNTESALEEEKLKLAIHTAFINGRGTMQELNQALKSQGLDENNLKENEDGKTWEYTGINNDYIIDSKGNVTKVGREDEEEDLNNKLKNIKVGDFIEYEPDDAQEYSKSKLSSAVTGADNNLEGITQEKLNWQILRIYNDGSMDLIGSPTSQKIYFKNALGYNNGVYVMNDICKSLYSKDSKGITARSVNLEDLESWLTAEGEENRNNYELDNKKYGIAKTYTGGFTWYPNLYAQEKGQGINSDTISETGIDSSTAGIEQPINANSTQASGNKMTVKNTFYSITIDENNYGDGAKALSNDTDFWIASRYVYSSSSDAWFGLQLAGRNIGGNAIFFSSGGSNSFSYSIRPVVSLKSDVNVIASSGANSSNNPHKINWTK